MQSDRKEYRQKGSRQVVSKREVEGQKCKQEDSGRRRRQVGKKNSARFKDDFLNES